MVLFRILGVFSYLFLAVLILGFIFSNRSTVSVHFFPFGSSGDMPLYLLLCVIFCAGLMIGLIHSASVWTGMRREVKRSQRAIAELEKEIAAKQAGTP